MNVPAKKRATYQDLLEVPDQLVAEIVEGELNASPRPTLRHRNVSSVLMAELGGPFRRGRGGPGGWVILVEPEIHLQDDVLVPDLAGWRRDRMPVVEGAFATIAPDWVCEVLSPGTARLDRARKMPVYLREGVGHAWLIDPDARTLEVYRSEQARWVLLGTHDDAQKLRAEPFDAIELDLSLLWEPAR